MRQLRIKKYAVSKTHCYQIEEKGWIFWRTWAVQENSENNTGFDSLNHAEMFIEQHRQLEKRRKDFHEQNMQRFANNEPEIVAVHTLED